MPEELFTCCFCGHKFDTKPNNAAPVVEKGECCDECNKNVVLPYRMGMLLHSVYRAQQNFIYTFNQNY